MFKPHRLITAIAGFAAGGALIAGPAAAAPAAKAYGKDAYIKTTDKGKTGQLEWDNERDRLLPCENRSGYYAHAMLWAAAGKGKHKWWKAIGTMNVNNACKNKRFNLREGRRVRIKIVDRKKGSKKQYSPSRYGYGRA